jgi:hypothetical protein
MAPADLLISLRERVPLTMAQTMRATGAEKETVGGGLSAGMLRVAFRLSGR